MEKRVHPDLRKMFSVMPAQSDSFNEENLSEIRKNLDAMIIEMNKSCISHTVFPTVFSVRSRQ